MEAALKIEAFENVWDALEDTAEDAARMTVLSQLMMASRRRSRDGS
jgi:predicted XRE-type DNA-binding protein